MTSGAGQLGFQFDAASDDDVAALPPEATPTDDAGRLAWLRLARSENVGPATFLDLMRRYASAEAVLEAISALSGRPGARRIALCSVDRAEAEMAAAEALGARLLCLGADAFPPLLARIDAPPPALWALGDPSVLQHPTVAIVGARNASALGKRFARDLGRDLVDAGLSVVSGLARGVDAAAHAGSLDPGGRPSAAAVLAGGVDHIYPPEHAALHAQLCAEGLVLSEMPIGCHPQARHFPRRNRIVSGVALAVVVVEAAERSGSLITARFAGEQGRDALAVPGHPLDARASGCNALIREGATLVRGAADVLEALPRRAPAPMLVREDSPLLVAPLDAEMSDDAVKAAIFALLGPTPIDIDGLLRQLETPDAANRLALLELELEGRIERRPGGLVCRAADAV